MVRKILALLAISPLALTTVANLPASAQTEALSTSSQACSQLFSANSPTLFNTYHIYPNDTNLYAGPLEITSIKDKKFTGYLNLDGSKEEVSGKITSDTFKMERKSGQTWIAKCTPGGLSGNFKKSGSSLQGAFLLLPKTR